MPIGANLMTAASEPWVSVEDVAAHLVDEWVRKGGAGPDDGEPMATPGPKTKTRQRR